MRLVALSVAALVEENDPVLLRQGLSEAWSDPASVRRPQEAVQEHDGRAVSFKLQIVQLHLIRGGEPPIEGFFRNI
ncbi:hypothetical protein POL68_06740 [Stigmatella sp. ncwal1]|uniref:Uncharacterized protein n=1 Tax=Stigmatella ashevillensis TaxID=2995309 RepID=A0ABT5D3B2_9BACT|nr:hypothetical protein [Stigmatella ashevillena]MDC0708161.1 hypothetical protein [Stigmatella ashevillena]